MSYRLFRFGSTTLPILEASHEIGGGASKTAVIETAGGQIDLMGSGRASRALHTVQFDGRVFGTPESVQAQIDVLKPLRGKKARLYRRMPDGSVQWTLARLESIGGIHGSRNARSIPITMLFTVIPQTWYGANHDGGWVLDSGEYLDYGLYLDSLDYLFILDTTPKVINTIVNNGNVTVENVVITVTAGSTNMTAWSLTRPGISLNYAGTILAGESLVIDCGARTVKNDGADAYSDFSLGAAHASESWYPIEPGSNSATINRTGGGTDATVLFNFCDGWE